MRYANLISAAIFGLSSTPVFAITLLEQTGVINGGGVLSSGNSPSYDDFKLGDAATVTGVSWWAQLFATPVTSTFTISFTTSIGYYPDLSNVLYSTVVTATSYHVGDFTEKFDVLLPVAALLPGNTDLFISISSIAGGPSWGRAGNAPSPGVFGSANYLVTYLNGAPLINAVNAAWSLEGTFGAPPTAKVPEPATWGMMVVGFGAVGSVVRRRRRVVRTA